MSSADWDVYPGPLLRGLVDDRVDQWRTTSVALVENLGGDLDQG